MPLYSYSCHDCRAITRAFRHVEERARTPRCQTCHSMETFKILEAPQVVSDYAPYECPITGKLISGRRQHEENLKQHGCRLFEPGEYESFNKRKAHADDALMSSIEATVESEIHNMPVEKRDRLAAELQNGIGADIVRG